MAGNKAGAAKALKTRLDKYGTDYYKVIGRKGGLVKKPVYKPLTKHNKA